MITIIQTPDHFLMSGIPEVGATVTVRYKNAVNEGLVTRIAYGWGKGGGWRVDVKHEGMSCPVSLTVTGLDHIEGIKRELLATRNDGPVSSFTYIARAAEMIASHPYLADVVANALYVILSEDYSLEK